jgi:hypothetical protein
MKNAQILLLKSISFFLLLSILSVFKLDAQTSNINTSFNLDKGAIEINFELSGSETSLYDVYVSLVQVKDSKLIEIPAKNISPSLTKLSPGKHNFEISFADLQIEGEFITKLSANVSGSSSSKSVSKSVKSDKNTEENKITSDEEPKMFVKKNKKKSESQSSGIKEEEVEKTDLTEEKKITSLDEPKSNKSDNFIPETNISSKAINNNSTSLNVSNRKVIKGIAVRGTSITDLSNKIKTASSEIMILGDLTPINIKLDFKKLTFSCDYVSNNSNLFKMGLYFGPKSTGCESCINVIINNPGSTVLFKGSNNVFDYELIGLKRN